MGPGDSSGKAANFRPGYTSTFQEILANANSSSGITLNGSEAITVTDPGTVTAADLLTIDGKTIGSGTPGPVFKRLYAAYQQAKTA